MLENKQQQDDNENIVMKPLLNKMARDDDENNLDENENSNSTDDKEITKFHFKLSERSKGCIQHDYYDWKIHKREYIDNHYTLAVAAYQKWQRKQEPVPLAVVVRIEDESRSAYIYTAIQSEIATMTEARIAMP